MVPLRVLLGLGLAGCPGHADHPRGGGPSGATLEIGRPGAELRGVAGDATTTFAALTVPLSTSLHDAPVAQLGGRAGARTTIEARRGERLAWHADLAGTGGVLARTGDLLVATLATGDVPGGAVRGEPGALVVALDAGTGATRWQLPLGATEYALVTALAPARDGVLVAGSFGGTLRIGAQVVSSAGISDGFVARLDARGGVGWLVRVGGPGADAIQGVAWRGERIAIAGTFTAGADVLGMALPPVDERSGYGDGFVAELDEAGARVWVATFGSKQDDTVAGVAIDEKDRVIVAASVRDVVHVGDAELSPRGPSDGLVAWWQPAGAPAAAVLVGGLDFDGLRGIAASGDRAVVAGFFSGTLELGARKLSAGGGDDAFIAALDAHGEVVTSWQVGGDGREEVTALAPVPGGFIAGIAHTARADIDGAPLPAPSDPMGGAALAVRAVP